MENTAIEELISNHKKRLDETKQLNSSFWYLQQLENDATELIEKEKELQAKHEEELIRLNDLLMVSRSIYKEGSESDQRWEASLANHIKPNTKEL
jgi:hypothetical protein